MTGINLQRRIQEHRKFMGNVFLDDSDRTVVEALATLKPTWSVPPPGVSNRQNPVGLTDIYHIDLLTDQGPRLEWLNDADAGNASSPSCAPAIFIFLSRTRRRWRSSTSWS